MIVLQQRQGRITASKIIHPDLIARPAEALDHVTKAREALESGVTLDAVGVMCENALDRLYELSGEQVSETVVDQVFRRFCVGK